MLAVDLLTAAAKNKMVFKVPWGRSGGRQCYADADQPNADLQS